MNRKLPKIDLPRPEQDRPPWKLVTVIGIVGLGAGLVWPTLAGMQIGPSIPGATRSHGSEPDASSPAVSASSSLPVAPSASPAASTAQPTDHAPSNRQVVVVGEGTIGACWDGGKRVDAELCGALRVDPVLVPRLEDLASCPSALGLSAEMELGFVIDFDKKEIQVRRGKTSKMPSSTTDGVLRCVADSVRDVELERIEHKHAKYIISYSLRLYPPGTGPLREPPAETVTDAGSGDRKVEAAARVVWDSVLLRSEPRTGEVVVRLVRGTRVELLEQRGDWFRVRMRSKEGWVHRSAIGL